MLEAVLVIVTEAVATAVLVPLGERLTVDVADVEALDVAVEDAEPVLLNVSVSEDRIVTVTSDVGVGVGVRDNVNSRVALFLDSVCVPLQLHVSEAPLVGVIPKVKVAIRVCVPGIVTESVACPVNDATIDSVLEVDSVFVVSSELDALELREATTVRDGVCQLSDDVGDVVYVIEADSDSVSRPVGVTLEVSEGCTVKLGDNDIVSVAKLVGDWDPVAVGTIAAVNVSWSVCVATYVLDVVGEVDIVISSDGLPDSDRVTTTVPEGVGKVGV